MLSKGVSILHDNAHPHVARATIDLLNQFGWDIIIHRPYSPDLAPSDYHLFTHLKEHMGGMRFDDDDKVKEQVKHYLNELAASFYDTGIQKLPEWLKKCNKCNGDFIEK